MAITMWMAPLLHFSTLFFPHFIRIPITTSPTAIQGYGISFAGIDFAEANNFTLIVALDCGIRSNDKADYAREKGIDFIICDHHLPGEEIPAASAVLDRSNLIARIILKN